MIYSVPNIVSLCRILLIPLLIISFYINNYWMAFIIFLIACFTDFLDGYLARVLSQTSDLGQTLDPIADKLLVSSTLLLLAGFDKISHFGLIPAIVILCREILVSGLREFLSGISLNMPVTTMAKWKTAIQMIAISCLLLSGNFSLNYFLGVRTLGEVLLWVAALITMVTGWNYLRSSFKHF